MPSNNIQIKSCFKYSNYFYVIKLEAFKAKLKLFDVQSMFNPADGPSLKHRSLLDRSSASVMKTTLLQTIILYLNASSTGINNWNNYQDKPPGSRKALEILTLLRTWQRLMQIHKLVVYNRLCFYHFIMLRLNKLWGIEIRVRPVDFFGVLRSFCYCVTVMVAQLALRMIWLNLCFAQFLE